MPNILAEPVQGGEENRVLVPQGIAKSWWDDFVCVDADSGVEEGLYPLERREPGCWGK